MSEQPPPSKRIRLSKDDLRHIAKDELISRWLEQETYLNTLEDLVRDSDRLGVAEDLSALRVSEASLKGRLEDVKKRENVLILKLAAKEQEANEYRNHIQMLKTSSTPSVTQLKSLLLDPAVNLMFQRMKSEVKEAKKKEKEAHDDLQAWQFTPDSQTGKRLMARCRSLLQENESIGKMIASGRVAKIEGELALQRRLVDEMKSGQAELDVFIAELDEDVEGMQSTIYLLQHQLREARTQMAQIQSENQLLKSGQVATTASLSFPATSKDSAGVLIGGGEANHHSSFKDEAIGEQGGQGQRQDSIKPNKDKVDVKLEDCEDSKAHSKTLAATSAAASPDADAAASHQRSNGHGAATAAHEEGLDKDACSNVDKEMAAAAAAAQEESIFTLTVKDSERQELEGGFENVEDDLENAVEGGSTEATKQKDNDGKPNGVGVVGGGGGKNKYQHDNNPFNNNGTSAKRPYSPADEEDSSNVASAEKMNGSDSPPAPVASTRASSRSSNNVAASPAKRARGASGGGSRSSRARRVSVDEHEDVDSDGGDGGGSMPAVKGRSPRAASRPGVGSRGTRANAAVTKAEGQENGMDCD